MSEEKLRTGIQPCAPSPEAMPREVVISHAWGDETPEGKIREKVAERLYTALEEDGFRPVRDRDEIHPGERISAFMRRLTRADLVVAVISDKYLRSENCMRELHGLWLRSQKDPDVLVQTLVPIVLPDVQASSPEDWAAYIEHWSERRAALEALIKRLGLDAGIGLWERARVVREFEQDMGDILAFLADVLMPRNLEAHLDDGFEAVRDALRRRIGTASS